MAASKKVLTKKKAAQRGAVKTDGVKGRLRSFTEKYAAVRSEVEKTIVGQKDVVDHALKALFAGGHVLLEGAPGLGKTLLVKTLSQVLSLSFNRVQFTPDMIPADITGTTVVVSDAKGAKRFDFRPGPVFCALLLADEINRATPKTQSALLEAMAELSVSTGGTTRPLAEPFCVLATQNPIEMEGTYPLPEAQLDRFLFKLLVEMPKLSELSDILGRTTGKETPQVKKVLSGHEILDYRALLRQVPAAKEVVDFASALVLKTHPRQGGAAQKYLRFGASPRAAQGLIMTGKINAVLDGRTHTAKDDVLSAVYPVLRHRVLLNFEAEADGIKPDEVIGKIIKEVL